MTQASAELDIGGGAAAPQVLFRGTEGRRCASDAVAGDEARDLARMGTGCAPLVGLRGRGVLWR